MAMMGALAGAATTTAFAEVVGIMKDAALHQREYAQTGRLHAEEARVSTVQHARDVTVEHANGVTENLRDNAAMWAGSISNLMLICTLLLAAVFAAVIEGQLPSPDLLPDGSELPLAVMYGVFLGLSLMCLSVALFALYSLQLLLSSAFNKSLRLRQFMVLSLLERGLMVDSHLLRKYDVDLFSAAHKTPPSEERHLQEMQEHMRDIWNVLAQSWTVAEDIPLPDRESFRGEVEEEEEEEDVEEDEEERERREMWRWPDMGLPGGTSMAAAAAAGSDGRPFLEGPPPGPPLPGRAPSGPVEEEVPPMPRAWCCSWCPIPLVLYWGDRKVVFVGDGADRSWVADWLGLEPDELTRKQIRQKRRMEGKKKQSVSRQEHEDAEQIISTNPDLRTLLGYWFTEPPNTASNSSSSRSSRPPISILGRTRSGARWASETARAVRGLDKWSKRLMAAGTLCLYIVACLLVFSYLLTLQQSLVAAIAFILAAAGGPICVFFVLLRTMHVANDLTRRYTKSRQALSRFWWSSADQEANLPWDKWDEHRMSLPFGRSFQEIPKQSPYPARPPLPKTSLPPSQLRHRKRSRYDHHPENHHHPQNFDDDDDIESSILSADLPEPESPDSDDGRTYLFPQQAAGALQPATSQNTTPQNTTPTPSEGAVAPHIDTPPPSHTTSSPTNTNNQPASEPADRHAPGPRMDTRPPVRASPRTKRQHRGHTLLLGPLGVDPYKN